MVGAYCDRRGCAALRVHASRSDLSLAMSSNEQAPLLAPNYARSVSPNAEARTRRAGKVRAIVGVALGLLFVAGVPLMLFLGEKGWKDGLPKDPKTAVELVLRSSPVIVSIIYHSSSNVR
jgi:hypothetical protein